MFAADCLWLKVATPTMLPHLLLALLLLSRSSADPLLVHTDCGPVQGVADPLLGRGFFGIPYATPPLPPHQPRWKRSILLSEGGGCWAGALNASTVGGECAQIETIYNPVNTSAPRVQWNGTEDCLTLDVWAPPPSAAAAVDLVASTPSSFATQPQSASSVPALLPVLVYIHGGSLEVGKDFPFPAFKNRTDVVIVGVKYRLNMLGFLALEALSSHDPLGVSGNYGFSDQLTALRWVQANIAGFGGDKDQVTVMGCSSGGSSVWNLVASPMAVGLFHRAIPMSGGSRNNVTLKQAEAANMAFTRAVGCDGGRGGRGDNGQGGGQGGGDTATGQQEAGDTGRASGGENGTENGHHDERAVGAGVAAAGRGDEGAEKLSSLFRQYRCLQNLTLREIMVGYNYSAYNYPFWARPYDFELPVDDEFQPGVCIIDGVIVPKDLHASLADPRGLHEGVQGQGSMGGPGSTRVAGAALVGREAPWNVPRHVPVLVGTNAQEGDSTLLHPNATVAEYLHVLKKFVKDMNWMVDPSHVLPGPAISVKEIVALYDPTSAEFRGSPKVRGVRGGRVGGSVGGRGIEQVENENRRWKRFVRGGEERRGGRGVKTCEATLCT